MTDAIALQPPLTVSRFTRILIVSSFVSVIAAASMVMGLMVLLVHPVKVVVLTANTVPVLSEKVTAGGSIVYRESYCKYMDAPSTRMRQLVSVPTDGSPPLVVALPIVGAELSMGCHTLDIVENVPSYVPAGRYRLEVTRIYRLYRLRDVPMTIVTEPFTVLPPIAKVNR